MRRHFLLRHAPDCGGGSGGGTSPRMLTPPPHDVGSAAVAPAGRARRAAEPVAAEGGGAKRGDHLPLGARRHHEHASKHAPLPGACCAWVLAAGCWQLACATMQLVGGTGCSTCSFDLGTRRVGFGVPARRRLCHPALLPVAPSTMVVARASCPSRASSLCALLAGRHNHVLCSALCTVPSVARPPLASLPCCCSLPSSRRGFTTSASWREATTWSAARCADSRYPSGAR